MHNRPFRGHSVFERILKYFEHRPIIYQKYPFKAGMKHNKFFRVMFCYVLCQFFYSSVMLCSVM